MLFWDLAPPTLQNSGIYHDSTQRQLQFAAEIAAIRRLYIGLRVRYKYYKNTVVLVWPKSKSTTIGVCKIVQIG